MRDLSADVLVLGAGAAGLGAARELQKAGLKGLVLEARDRPGGRMSSLHTPRSLEADEIELGAEFVHGDSGAVWDLAREAGLPLHALPDRHLMRRPDGGGSWTELKDFWTRLSRVFARLPSAEDEELTFGGLERRLRGRVPSEDLELAWSFVEGFHAADPDRISARALAHEVSAADESGGGGKIFRLEHGYGALTRVLVSSLDPARISLELGAVVREVHWSAGEVRALFERLEAPGRPEVARAHAAIVTLPLAVLQAEPFSVAGVRFAPELEAKRGALSDLAMGSVQKIIFRFRPDFLAREAPPALREAAFLHSPRETFPTWWPHAGVEALWVGWAGGPAAERLGRLSATALADEALASLERLCDVDRGVLSAQVESFHRHDWQRDPRAGGAYSYVLVGGFGAERALAAPLRGTLFFAGEATAFDGQIGTVDGALASGYRAAREAAAALLRAGGRGRTAA